MRDERRECANCGHSHAYGILRYSVDSVPLYGARKCWCGCDHFVQRNEEAERKFLSHDGAQLPATLADDKEIKELWADTAFLNPQVPMATRIAVRQINSLFKATDGPCKACGHPKDVHTSERGSCRDHSAIPSCECGEYIGCPDANALITKALPEFAGLMISQLTDIRGAMTRDESKFNHLVSHTDEVVESMRGVVQLSERLTNILRAQHSIQERQEKMERDIAGIAAVLKKLLPEEVEIHESSTILANGSDSSEPDRSV